MNHDISTLLEEPPCDGTEKLLLGRGWVRHVWGKGDLSWKANVGQVHADERLRMGQCQQARDPAPNVPAGHGILLVAEHLGHQPRQQLGGADRGCATSAGAVREAKPRQRRHDHIEGISRIATIAGWIGKPRDNFVVPIERVRPAVEQEQARVVRIAGAQSRQLQRPVFDDSALHGPR